MVRNRVGDSALCVVCERLFHVLSVDGVRICDSCWGSCCMNRGYSRCIGCHLGTLDRSDPTFS